MWANNIRNHAKGVFLEVRRRLVLASGHVDGDDLEGDPLLVEDGSDPTSAGCFWGADKLEDHYCFADGCRCNWRSNCGGILVKVRESTQLYL